MTTKTKSDTKYKMRVGGFFFKIPHGEDYLVTYCPPEGSPVQVALVKDMTIPGGPNKFAAYAAGTMVNALNRSLCDKEAAFNSLEKQGENIKP